MYYIKLKELYLYKYFSLTSLFISPLLTLLNVIKNVSSYAHTIIGGYKFEEVVFLVFWRAHFDAWHWLHHKVGIHSYTWCLFFWSLVLIITSSFSFFVHCALVMRCLLFFVFCVLFLFLFFDYGLKSDNLGDCDIPSDSPSPPCHNLLEWNRPTLCNSYINKGQHFN